MTKEYPHSPLSISDTMLPSQLSLACSSQDVEKRTSVDFRKLVKGALIREGSYYNVYKGWYEDHPVAIKILNRRRTEDAPQEYEAKFLREIKLLSKIEHMNVIKLIAASKGLSIIITELMESGSLKKYLKRIHPTTFSLEQCLTYALDVSQAMEYLHANGIVHRDLKPGNLLLTKDLNHVKLAGFGVARDDICDEMTCEAGTYRYMAPEQMSKDPLPKGAKKSYDHKADVYSFALVLWSLIKNQIPFKDRNDLSAAYVTKNNIRPSLHDLPEDIVPLLQSCWMEDPKLRPEFKEITETLKKILLNIYTAKTNALVGVKPNAEAGSKSEAESSKENENIFNHDIEMVTARAPILDGPATATSQSSPLPFLVEFLPSVGIEPQSSKENENIFNHDIETIEPNNAVQSQSELRSATQMSFHDLPGKKHKKKCLIKRWFASFRSCACL